MPASSLWATSSITYRAATSAEILPLTSIRGVAALWVVYGHLIGVLLRVLDAPQSSLRLPINLARGDQFAVDIFFILSGYIMIVAYGRHVDPPKFFAHRFARVFPLHIVTLGVAVVGFYLFKYSPLQPEAYSTRNLVFYMTLTSAWVGLPPAWNPPAWSLSVEAFAYLFFPLVHWPPKASTVAAHCYAFACWARPTPLCWRCLALPTQGRAPCCAAF